MPMTIYGPWGADIRGVLFDMDGLILDTEKLYSRFWQEAANDLGYPMTRQQALGMRSLNRGAGQAKLQEYFGPAISYQQVRQRRIELMDAYVEIHGIELMPGVRELLDYLDEQKIPRAITSSSPMAVIRRHLGAHNLLHRFDALCTVYDVPHGKPEPDIYLHGAAALGLAPEHCLALEDSPTGILAAYRAGCIPVMVPDQDQPGEETTALLYAKSDSLKDLVEMISHSSVSVQV